MVFRRRNKLIRPGIQLKLTLTFVVTAGLAALLQAALLADALSAVAGEGPSAAASLANRLPSILIGNLLLTLALLVPLALLIGTIATFRIAGPLYRFETFLKQVAAGQRPEDCRIRKSDELQDLCHLINVATAPVRGVESAGDPEVEEQERRRAG